MLVPAGKWMKLASMLSNGPVPLRFVPLEPLTVGRPNPTIRATCPIADMGTGDPL
jgi:hypothetical protein